MLILSFYCIFNWPILFLSCLYKAASVSGVKINYLLVNKTKNTETKTSTRTLILGIGNPILRDDRVGHFLIQELRHRFSSPGIELQETSLAGLNLAELLSGFDSVIIIDAIQSGGVPGTVYCLKPRDFHAKSVNQYDQHGTGLLQALELGKALGWPMPEDVTIVAIEAEDVTSFGDDLTPAVAKAVPAALKIILELFDGQHEQPGKKLKTG